MRYLAAYLFSIMGFVGHGHGYVHGHWADILFPVHKTRFSSFSPSSDALGSVYWHGLDLAAFIRDLTG